MQELNPEILVKVKRGNTIEALHYGWICVIDKNKKIVCKKGNINDFVFLRSAAKPVQAISIIDNQIEVTPQELAIICGSHSASKKHLEALHEIMKRFNLKIADLRCGIHLPIDDHERGRLIKKNLKANPLYNNCSGKHLGMLAVCKKNNWDLKTYLNPDHPIQKVILKNIIKLSETKKIEIAVDGCGVPTFALPVINIAKMFSNFTFSPEYLKIISSMTKYPFYVGGKGQIDTEIMKATNGRLLSKVGAEGIIVVAFKGNALIVKIADGASRARSFIVLNLLKKLGWIKESEIKDSILKEILKGEIKNHAGKIVGKLI